MTANKYDSSGNTIQVGLTREEFCWFIVAVYGVSRLMALQVLDKLLANDCWTQNLDQFIREATPKT